MSEEDKIFACIQSFIENGLAGNIEKTMELISDTILGVGMGSQGTINGKADVLKILEDQNANACKKLTITYPRRQICFYPPSFGVGSVVYEIAIEESGTKSAFIQTASAVKEDGEWKLCLLQVIPAELSADGIESYPLKFADETLKRLREELQEEMNLMMSESISGGILSVCAEEPFGMRYANDSLLEALGYTREEFKQKFPPEKDCRELFSSENWQLIYDMKAEVKEHQTLRRRICLKKKNGSNIWMESRTRLSKDEKGKPVFLTVVLDVTELVNLQQETKEQNELILSSIRYASRIQNHILPKKEKFAEAFEDFAVIWEPRDIVGGDIYWMQNFKKGSLLCVCDCTGHGTPGALLTMLVTSALENIASEENCHDTSRILWELDQNLSQTLNARADQGWCRADMMDIRDGCDSVVLFIGSDGSVTLSASNMRLFYCDGREVWQIKGQRLHIGEGMLSSADEVDTVRIEGSRDNCYYIASDGLYDQIGEEENRPFGFREFQSLLLYHHGKKQQEILGKIWEAFELHQGKQKRRDDVQLIGFQPGNKYFRNEMEK